MQRNRYFLLTASMVCGISVATNSAYRSRRAEDREFAQRLVRSGGLWAPELIGPWQHNGRICFFVLSSDRLKIIDEIGAEADVELSGHGIAVRPWELRGQLSPERQTITWSDGTLWSRGAPDIAE